MNSYLAAEINDLLVNQGLIKLVFGENWTLAPYPHTATIDNTNIIVLRVELHHGSVLVNYAVHEFDVNTTDKNTLRPHLMIRLNEMLTSARLSKLPMQ
jgi:hypothetical protein